MNQNDISESVIRGSTRSPAVRFWIPAFAGMTGKVVIPAEAGIHNAL